MNNLKNIYKIELVSSYKFYTNSKNKDYKKCRINYIM